MRWVILQCVQHFGSLARFSRHKWRCMHKSTQLPKIPHLVIVKSPGLLPMLYSLRELEEELGLSSRTIREWLGRGLPYQRDQRGHIWINGVEFAAWVESARKSKRGHSLGAGEAFCFHCRRPVKLLDCQSQRVGKRILRKGACPDCGSAIVRWGRNGQS
jgi:hypothetical protein